MFHYEKLINNNYNYTWNELNFVKDVLSIIAHTLYILSSDKTQLLSLKKKNFKTTKIMIAIQLIQWMSAAFTWKVVAIGYA